VVAKRLENASKYQDLQDENDTLIEQINANDCQISNLIQSNEHLAKEKDAISAEVETIYAQMEEFKDFYDIKRENEELKRKTLE